MSHPDVDEYYETLQTLRLETLERARDTGRRARALLAAIIHGEATADEIVDAVKDKKRH